MLDILDWIIIAFYLVITIVIGLYYTKRAGKSIDEFFLSGRNLPWYIAGLSMVATTFAADTPLAVAELVGINGISGNWIWWNFLIGGMLTTFFFAKLWRRAGILTEVELIHIRYSGKAALFLRQFKAVYLGFFMNILIIGWVNYAFITILQVFFGLSLQTVYFYVFGLMLLVALYSSMSGLWGVAVTDAIQFVIAMTSCIVLAFLVVNSAEIGGISGLKSKIDPQYFRFFPKINTGNLLTEGGKIFTITIGSFLAFIGVQWWASWYPGAEPGGGGYIAQRMMSTKNEKDATFSTLLFQIAHYAIRPWPWILVGLAAVYLYPNLGPDEKRLGYVYAMKDFLPAGLKGLMLVGFFAAYMSTIATQLNWGAAYLVNDFFRVNMKSLNSEKKMILLSRIITLLLSVTALVITLFIKTISGVWLFVLECGAGLGLVLILRWYWWRINAWSELTATFVPVIAYAVVKFGFNIQFPDSFFIIVTVTTLAWLIVTFLTKPDTTEQLNAFYRRINPEGWWKPVRLALGLPKPPPTLGVNLIRWITAVLMTYSLLFAIGKLIFAERKAFLIYTLLFVTGLIVLIITYRKESKKEAISKD